MAQSFPTEILERIIFFYFRQDELLHTPEDNFTLVTPSRGSTSLLLVSRDFRLLVLPSLFYSVSISREEHWELFFRKGYGILDGEKYEARTRRSWVRELRIRLDLELPIAFEPDGFLPQDPPLRSDQAKRSLLQTILQTIIPTPQPPSSPTSTNQRQRFLITLSSPNDPSEATASFLPNLNRLTLLHSPTTSIPVFRLPRDYEEFLNPWSSENIQQIRQHQLTRRKPNATNDFLPRDVLHELYFESGEKKDRFFEGLGCKEVWVSMADPASVRELARRRPVWTNKEVVKHIVYPSFPLASLPSSSSSLISPRSTTTTNTPPIGDTFLVSAAITEEFRFLAFYMRRVHFLNVPLPLRRRLWVKLSKMSHYGTWYDCNGEEEGEQVKEGELSDMVLECLKEGWVWVEEDGTEVEFEEGLTPVVEE